MRGDLSKHDLLRSVGVARRLQSALEASGVSVDTESAMLALDDFYRRFHTDILNYHGTYLIEMLNNIRWGIHDYLTPEFHRSYTPTTGNPPMYEYQYPADVVTKFGRDRYWDLMNTFIRGPIIPRFRTAQSFKKRY
jgi:hypothetical protein